MILLKAPLYPTGFFDIFAWVLAATTMVLFLVGLALLAWAIMREANFLRRS